MQGALTAASVEALGFATAAALCAMLLVMYRRVSTAFARGYAWFWFTGLVYASAAFFTATISLSGDASPELRNAAESVTWSSTCIGPLIFAGLLQPHDRWHRIVQALRVAAFAASFALAARFAWVLIETGFDVGESTFPAESFYVSLVFALACVGVAVIGRAEKRPAAGRPLRWFAPVASALALVQVIATLDSIHEFSESSAFHSIFTTISALWVLPWTVVLAFFFAQARFADVALKRTLIVIVTVIAAAVLVWLTGGAAHDLAFVTTSLVVSAAMLGAPALYRLLQHCVDRILLQRPEYHALARTFAEDARRIADSEDLMNHAARLIGDALSLSATFSPAASASAVASSIAVVPVGTQGLLVIEDRIGARTLMQEEFAFLETIATHVAQRLESLQFETERRELQLNEERLQRVLIETQLKALRAQVDPHFLFNTLNAIADLVSRSPDQAEAMIERLAECFRYALSRQETPMSTLEDELQFIQRYLAIEQVRFGSRLRVELSSEATLSQTKVPSLILQPLVENAVRHGLASKLDGGCVRVTASHAGEYLQLEVADDGVGIDAQQPRREGVGLKNVRERLQLLYRDRARMTISAGARGSGTSIMLWVPAL